MLERFNPANWHIAWDNVAVSAAAVALAVVAAYLVYRMVFAVAGRLARLSETEVDEMVLDRVRRPVKWGFFAIGVTLVAQVEPELKQLWEPMARFVRPALLGWIAYTLVKAFTAALEYRLEISDDPVAVRSRRTRISVLSRTATFAIILITAGLMLMGIPGVRDIGTTLLASAGLAALAVGAAAQPALKSLIGGLQMAFTEPLRIGDLVKVDGQTGRVEEIRMGFVTVRTWDERVLIVPTNRFLDQPFENWSRRNEALTGPVFLHLDPAVDVAPIRAEFERYVETNPLFDGRNHQLLVTEAFRDSVELRMSVSARTIADLFELRCQLREHMLKWLRDNQADALIRHRLEPARAAPPPS